MEVLKQLVLLRQGGIDGCLHGLHSTLEFGEVKSTADTGGQKLVCDVERSHDGDALHRCNLPGIAYFAHLLVQVGHRIEQFATFILGAGYPEFAVEDGYIQGTDFAHEASSGSWARSLSRRCAASSILSWLLRCWLTAAATS